MEMQYRRLGATGLEVSAIGLGCGNFGGIGSAPAFFGMGETEAQALVLMDRAWAAGVNLFDTADAYGGGRSEQAVGRWIAARGPAVRDRLVLTTKVFNPVGPGPNERGLSRRHVLRQIDASLSRLRTDWIDLYLMHEPDPQTPLEETLVAFDDAVRAGKVRYVGVSNVEAWRLMSMLGMAEARQLTRCACVQNGFSLLDQLAAREVLPACAAAGVGFTAFSPLAGGWLTGKYRADAPFPDGSRMTLRPEPYRHLTTHAIFSSLQTLEAHARDRETTTATLALAWVLRHPHVTSAIVGPRTPAQLDLALAALDVWLTADEIETLASLFP